MPLSSKCCAVQREVLKGRGEGVPEGRGIRKICLLWWVYVIYVRMYVLCVVCLAWIVCVYVVRVCEWCLLVQKVDVWLVPSDDIRNDLSRGNVRTQKRRIKNCYLRRQVGSPHNWLALTLFPFFAHS